MHRIYLLSEPQNHRCCYCGHEMIRHKHTDGEKTPANAMTKDHFEPRAYGGETTLENMVAACYQCNHLRGEIDAVAFYNLLQKWFKRNETLRVRWHTLSRNELYDLRQKCLEVHERQLSGLALHYAEYAFRHFDFVLRQQKRAQWKQAWR